jgi:regulator of protease activity HflC (stomatin/prohibitin superfamily)
VGIVSKFGKAYKIIDPGMSFVNQMTESVKKVDVKIQMTPVPRQVVMTKDNVTLTIDSALYWHIVDPFVAIYHVENVYMALLERTMTTLRDTIGAHTLQNVIENREALAAEIKRIIEGTSRSWGVVVESILIKDMSFSEELQKTLAAAAKQKRLGESKVITAKAEVQAARLMREASDILSTPAAIQIRYLETLTMMSQQPGTKIIFLPKEAENKMEKLSKDIVLSNVG